MDSETMNRLNNSRSSKIQRFFQFRLITLLVIMVPIGLVSLWIGERLDNRPIDWVPYSKSTLDEHLSNNKTVLIFFGADWNMTSQIYEQTILEAQSIRRIIRRHKVIAMKADMTNKSDENTAAMRSIDRHAVPVIAIYNTKRLSQPIILDTPINESELLEALNIAVNRW